MKQSVLRTTKRRPRAPKYLREPSEREILAKWAGRFSQAKLQHLVLLKGGVLIEKSTDIGLGASTE